MSSELGTAVEAARAAGEEILRVQKKGFTVQTKKDASLVTEADITSEKVIFEHLSKFPYPILSEETEIMGVWGRKEKIWIVDPLDGTNDFIEGTKEYSVMIGLAEAGKSMLGVVYQPESDILYFAERGQGAFMQQGKQSTIPLRVSEEKSISNGRFLFSRSHLGEDEQKFIENEKIGSAIRMGSSGVKLGVIARGDADAYFTKTDKTFQWDYCAADVILREAGGEITDLRGEPLDYARRERRNLYGIVATNGALHKALLEKL